MKRIFAIALVAAMLFSFAACGGKEETTTAPTEEITSELVNDVTEAPVEDITAAPVEDTTAAPVADTTAAEGESTTVDATASTEATTAAKAPATTAEILAVYNKAVNSAYDAKAGFKKERYVDNEKMDASLALQAFKSLVYKFMGIGADNKYTENVTKGQWNTETNKHYLRKSTLTEADLKSATCTQSGANYTIVLNVKDGTSVGSKEKQATNAPIDKCGICVGKEDKGYYDHKTGEVIYDAIDDTYAGASIEERYNNAKVTATVDAASGKLVKLVVEYGISCNIDIGIGTATASGNSHIIYNDVKY